MASKPQPLSWFDLLALPEVGTVPDMAQAEPIEAALAVLDRAAVEGVDSIYPLFWLNRLRAIGGSASVFWQKVDGEWQEYLLTGGPCDSQTGARSAYIDALSAHMHSVAGARQAIIDRQNKAGRFADGRPFGSPEDAVNQALAVGIRLMINRAGELEPNSAIDGDFVDRDCGTGWPLKRAWHRFCASRNRPGWEAQIINIIRQRGTVHDGSGWIVLERKAA